MKMKQFLFVKKLRVFVNDAYSNISVQPPYLVTMVLVCYLYNQEKYIKEAVLSVLSQDYSDLKIITSDELFKR